MWWNDLKIFIRIFISTKIKIENDLKQNLSL